MVASSITHIYILANPWDGSNPISSPKDGKSSLFNKQTKKTSSRSSKVGLMVLDCHGFPIKIDPISCPRGCQFTRRVISLFGKVSRK